MYGCSPRNSKLNKKNKITVNPDGGIIMRNNNTGERTINATIRCIYSFTKCLVPQWLQTIDLELVI